LPVESFPVKTLSTRDQNGKLSTGKLSTDKVYKITLPTGKRSVQDATKT
jgi:hypothetical protein